METPGKTLFVNANLVLDGFAELQKSFEVLVQGSRIVAVSQTPLNHEEAQVIDVRGHRNRASARAQPWPPAAQHRGVRLRRGFPI